MHTLETNTISYSQEQALKIGLEEKKILALTEKVVSMLKARGLYITTVESCTGGALANAITNIPGASEVMKDSFVTYSNEAKLALGIPNEILDTYTVYSIETAAAMAEAGKKKSVQADISVGITGSISRPDPTNPNSEPGTIYVAVKYKNQLITKKLEIPLQERLETKQEILIQVLQIILDTVSNEKSNSFNSSIK